MTLNEEDSNLILQFAISSDKTIKNKGKNSNLKSQITTSSWGGSRKGTYVFTEQGIAMLSSVLKFDIIKSIIKERDEPEKP